MLGMNIRMCTIITTTSGNWNWLIWIRGGLAKCKIHFQSRRYESQVNKHTLPSQPNVPNSHLDLATIKSTNQLPDAGLHTRMCTLMGATSNNRPNLIPFRNQLANGKIHFQTLRSHDTQSALMMPINPTHMPRHSTQVFVTMSVG
jgi:hypothetical protein